MWSQKKLEDSNHFAKRMLNRIKKIKQDNNGKLLSDGKKSTGKGHMTDAHAIKFIIHFAKATHESNSDLDKLYKRSWQCCDRYRQPAGPVEDS